MAQFRGVLQGQRGEASRLGNKNTGLEVLCHGWEAGVRIMAYHENGKDIFKIWTNGGSNNPNTIKLLATIKDGVVYRPPSPDCLGLCDVHCNGGS